MTAASTIRLPVKFFRDHYERDLPTPSVVKETRSHVWVRSDDPAIADLRADAEHYGDPDSFEPEYRHLRKSAQATIAALDAAAH